MESRGAITGGLTILEVLADYESRGYRGQFAAREGGALKCFSCGRIHDPASVKMDSMQRVEGASDPADMALIGALRCAACGTWGTAVFKYGPDAPPADGEAMRLIEDVRRVMQEESGLRERQEIPEVGLDFHPEQRGPGM